MKQTKRSCKRELLDLGPSYYTQEEYENCLNQLARIGRFLGGDKASLKIFHKLPKPQTILDIGCGGGHFTLKLAEQFPKAQVKGIDISSQAIEFAQKHLQARSLKNIRFETSPSSHLPFDSNSYDIVTSTLVYHHLEDSQLINLLKNSYRIAKKFVIINDLHRHWLAYSGFALIAKLFFPNRLIFNDGLLSIQRAFKKRDLLHYLDSAEIPLSCCSITWHWAFRWIICIKKKG